MSIIELKNIHVEFPLDDGRVLHASRNVSLDFSPGEIVAVVGESGCGKSTIGKVALGVLEPTSGEVILDGEDIWDSSFRWTPHKRSIVQVIHQDPFASLNPVRTIWETLSAPLTVAKNRGLMPPDSDLRQEARRLLDMVGLTPADFYLEKYPFQLSGGQKQRVSIARSTIMKPKLILADEPVSAVDASMRLAILDLMRELCENEGISFLYVTHDLATARYFARDGRIVVMYLGEIIETGGIIDVLDEPLHPYLKALLTAIPVPDPRKAKIKRELPLKSYDVPSPIDLPPGCVFRPRCPEAIDQCAKERPCLRNLGAEGHLVSCHVANSK